jgi:hypothetical protein
VDFTTNTAEFDFRYTHPKIALAEVRFSPATSQKLAIAPFKAGRLGTLSASPFSPSHVLP